MEHFSWISMQAVIAVSLLCSPLRLRAEEHAEFHKPVRLDADGTIIDTGAAWGHSGPALADVDGDGLRDLVVGDYSGKFGVYRNVGSAREPAYAPVTYLMAGGVEAKVPIYCCIGSSPHFVDFDADGNLDLISGSYDPGECYLFRGLGDGKYAARETIVDRTGRPVLRRPDQRQNYESFGTWPVMVDWDDDGDLDLLVGTFEGTIFVRLNEGTREEPAFAAANTPVQAAGEELKIPGGHAAVSVADWDQDGLWDLLCGCDKGGVHFYRNVGEAGVPRFGAAAELIPPHQGVGYDELLEAGAEPPLGIRTQISAVDYDSNGRTDLLVGDFCTNLTPRPDLTAAERAEMLALKTQSEEATSGIRKLMEKLRDDFAERYPGDAVYSDEANAEWSKAYQALRESEEFRDAQKRSEELKAEINTFLRRPDKKSLIGDDSSPHGYVWLFRRK